MGCHESGCDIPSYSITDEREGHVHPVRQLAHFAQGEELARFDAAARKYGQHIMPIDEAHPANCVISGAPDGPYSMHGPILDDDGGLFRVVPSRTPGHQHVYVNKSIPWAKFERLLRVLADCELIDRSWAELSIQQGTATLRLPHGAETIEVL